MFFKHPRKRRSSVWKRGSSVVIRRNSPFEKKRSSGFRQVYFLEPKRSGERAAPLKGWSENDNDSLSVSLSVLFVSLSVCLYLSLYVCLYPSLSTLSVSVCLSVSMYLFSLSLSLSLSLSVCLSSFHV